jgi:hypothetical protein
MNAYRRHLCSALTLAAVMPFGVAQTDKPYAVVLVQRDGNATIYQSHP